MLSIRDMNDDTEPVERKVQLTGGSTYTVSLPKTWAIDQHIEPGATVNLYEQGDQLVMTRGPNGTGSEPQRAEITAGNRDSPSLSLSVASAYIAGCDEIHVADLRTREQRRAVIQAIRRFVGLEVMTETESTLTARTMLAVGDLSPEQTLAQIERTTLEMHHEAIAAVTSADGETGSHIAQQDDDVDRLFALVSRGFQQSLVDPAVTMGDGTLLPFEYYMAARQLERVADHAEKIASIAGRLDGPPPEELSTELTALGERTQGIVQDALAALLESPDDAAFSAVVTEAEQLTDELAALDEQLYVRDLSDGYLLSLVVDSLTRTTQYGVNIAEAGLQARHREGPGVV